MRQNRVIPACRTLVSTVTIICGLLVLAASATAQTPAAATGKVNKLRVLGRHPSRFYAPPLTSVASLKRYARNPRVVKEIGMVIEQAGLPSDIGAQLLAKLQEPGDVATQASCADPMPASGIVVDCGFPVGGTMEWMAWRKLVKGKRVPTIMHNVEWAGKKPFPAFMVSIDAPDTTYVFVVPKACGNLTLVRTIPKPKKPEPPAIDVRVDPKCYPAIGGKLTVTIDVTGDLSQLASVRVLLDGQPAGQLTQASPSMTSDKPGTYSFDATLKDGTPYPGFNEAPVPMRPCPEPALVNPVCRVTITALPVKSGHELTIDASGSGTGSPAVKLKSNVVRVSGPAMTEPNGREVTLDENGRAKLTVPRRPVGTYRVTEAITSPDVIEGSSRYRGEATCESTVDIVVPPGSVHFFADGLFGKERRQRPVSELDVVPVGAASDAVFGQCSPFFGGKFGIAKIFPNDWELAGAIGAAAMLVDTDEKVRKNPLFVDVEVNKYLKNDVFLGTGLSLWDITRGDTFTPAWMIHFGLPLNGGLQAHVPIYFLGEGRLFFDNIDSVDNNYQFWGGVRVQFPPIK